MMLVTSWEVSSVSVGCAGSRAVAQIAGRVLGSADLEIGWESNAPARGEIPGQVPSSLSLKYLHTNEFVDYPGTLAGPKI